MIEADYHKKHYSSAKRRFLGPLIARFFEREISSVGPEMSTMLAERIVELLEAVCPEHEHLKPGQLVWMALDKTTRAGSKNERIKPVILTLINESEADALVDKTSIKDVRKTAVARVCNEAYQQGAVLSTRDLAMIFHLSDAHMSSVRKAAEEDIGYSLPHTGVLHDMGSCITHKVGIVRKAVCERMDPTDVARATRHSQHAVDQYLKAFHKVQTLAALRNEPEFISSVTGMTKRLVIEYLNIIEDMQTHEN